MEMGADRRRICLGTCSLTGALQGGGSRSVSPPLIECAMEMGLGELVGLLMEGAMEVAPRAVASCTERPAPVTDLEPTSTRAHVMGLMRKSSMVVGYGMCGRDGGCGALPP